jgi:hypothetical protein
VPAQVTQRSVLHCGCLIHAEHMRGNLKFLFLKFLLIFKFIFYFDCAWSKPHIINPQIRHLTVWYIWRKRERLTTEQRAIKPIRQKNTSHLPNELLKQILQERLIYITMFQEEVSTLNSPKSLTANEDCWFLSLFIILFYLLFSWSSINFNNSNVFHSPTPSTSI